MATQSRIATFVPNDRETGFCGRCTQMSYASAMDHVEVLREKIGRLRTEIAQIQELNEQYRSQESRDPDAQVAHGQRSERLQAIQQELAQLALLGRKVQPLDEMKKSDRFRLHLVKKAS